MSLLGDMTVKFTADLSGLTAGISSAKAQINSLNSTAQSASSGLDDGVSGAAKRSGFNLLDFGAKVGATVFGLKSLADGAIHLGSALLEPNASMEQTKVGFETLLGAGQKTDAFLRQLQQFAAATPFEFPQLATDAEHMIAFGFSAKDVIPDLTAIGDAMGALGKGPAEIDGIVTVLGQMKAATKVNAQDMLQLTSAGIPAWKYLADAMHLSVAQVQKLSQEGKLTADKAIPALLAGMEKTFGGGMQKQAQTFNGLLSTFEDNISAAWRAFSGPLFDAAKGALIQIGNLVQSKGFQDFATNAGAMVARAFKDIGAAITPLLPTLQDVAMWLGRNLGDIIKGVVVPAFQMLGPVVQNVLKYLNSDQFQGFLADIQTLVNQLVNVLVPAFQALLPVVQGVFATLGPILTGVVIPALDQLVFTLGQIIMFFEQNKVAAGILLGVLATLAAAFIAMKVVALISFIGGLIEAIQIITVLATVAIPLLISSIVPAIVAFAPFILIGAAIVGVVALIILAVTHWGQIVTWLKGAWASVTAFFSGLWANIQHIFAGIGQWFHDRFTDAKNGVQSAFSGIGNWIADRFNDAKAGVSSAWTNINASVKSGTKTVNDTISTGFQAAGYWFQWLYDHNYYIKALVDFTVQVFNADKAFIIQIWTEISTWLGNTWNTIKNTAVNVWNAVSSFFTGIFNKIKGAVTSVWTYIVTWIELQWKLISIRAEMYWNAIYLTVYSYILKAENFIKSIWTAVTSWLSAQWNTLVASATSLWQRISSVFAGAYNTYIAGPLGSFGRSVAGFFGGLVSQAVTWGSNIIHGVANGISNAAGAVGDAIHGAISNALSLAGFHGIPGFAHGIMNSPYGQLAVVGERGPELMYVPKGASIFPNGVYPSQTPSSPAVAAAQAGAASVTHVHFYLDSRELADVVASRMDSRVRLQFGAHARV